MDYGTLFQAIVVVLSVLFICLVLYYAQVAGGTGNTASSEAGKEDEDIG